MRSDKARSAIMQERYGKLALEDPFSALNRDAQEASEEVHDNSPVYASAMVHLEALITQQKKTHQKMMIQMTAAEKRHKKVVHELEEEKRKHAQDTAQGDDVTYMLEKERERLSQQVDFEKSQLRKMEKDKNKAMAMLEEERAHHQQIGVLLAKERKRLASKLIQERQQLKDVHKGLQDQKDKVRSMAEGLVQESKKSLKMEAEMEKQLSEFDIEREQLRSKLSREEAKNRDLQTEVDEYRKQLEDMRKSLLKGASGDAVKPRAIMRSAGTQTENPPENEVRRREVTAAESKNYVSTVKQNLLRGAESTDTEKATKETRKASPWLKNAADKPIVSAWGPNPFPCTSVETEHHGKADIESSSDSEDDKTVIENVPPVSFKADGTSGITGERGPASAPPTEMSNSSPSRLSPSDSPRKLSTLKIEIGGGSMLDERREKHTTSNFLYLPAEKESQCFESSDNNNTVPNDAKSTEHSNSNDENDARTAEADTVEGEVAELCKTLLKKGGLGEETPVRGIPNRLHQAAGEGDITMVEQLLEEGADPNTTERDGSTPVYAAAEGGHLDCLELLLSHNGDPNTLRDDNFTPLHGAAAEGHTGCLKLLLDRGAHPGLPDKAGWSPLYWAVSNGHTDCCRTLLDYFASRAAVTDVGWTPLHGACRSGHVSCLKVLLYYDPLNSDGQDQAALLTTRPALVSKDVINAVDRDGWTAAHVAASRGFKDCLELLCGHPELDLTIRDKWDRQVQDVAVGDCRGLVEDIGKRKVSVVIDTSSETMVTGRTTPTPSGKEEDLYVLGNLTLACGTDWSQFDTDVGAILVQNSKKLSVASELLTELEEVDTDISADGHVSELGLTANSIRSYTYGTISWSPATAFDTTPYDFFSANKYLVIRLKGPDEDCVDKLSYESMIPVQTLQNYLRLIEQYKSVVFYGPPGTGKTFIVRKLAECIRNKQQQSGFQADISHVALNPKYTHKDLLQLLRSKGFLLPSNPATTAEGSQKAPILILDDLGRVSLSEVLGELLYALEYRGPQHPISMKIDEEGPKDEDGSSGAYYLSEDCYIIGTMDKSRSPGLDLSVQQRFRWVHLKCDSEPVKGLLQRHLRRRLISAHGGQLPSTDDQVYKAVEWVAAVWQRLNACLAKLGLPDLVLGPRHFFTCPIEATKVKAILRWLSLSWNHAIAPGVEDAMLRGLSSQNQQKLASTALSVLLQRAVIPGCPLAGQDAERYLSSFRGGYEGMVSLLNTAKRSAVRAKRTRSAWKRSTSANDGDSQDSDSTAAEGDSGVDSPDSPLSPTGPPSSTLTGSPPKKRPTSELARRVIENLHSNHHASSPDLRSAGLSNLAYLGATAMDGDVLNMLLKMQTSKSESNLNTVIELHDHIFNMHSRSGTIKRRPKVKPSSQTKPKEVKRESSEEEDNPQTKDNDVSDDKEPLQLKTDPPEGAVGDEVWSLRQDLQ
ncbi:cortactin-binding protein 2-like isoform X2 [Branchiostoma lanceolatum]|uniref:cortactin-binding protein 2-like isoform X2 n=1 Tax=Branchiostoma lanceolatum TaxID=7740 RepID=UPI0034525611